MKQAVTILIARFVSLVLLAVLATGCAFGRNYEAISGRVIDADTKEPLEGAVVVAVYYAAMISVGGTSRTYLDAQEAKTDSRGVFILPAKSLSRVLLFGHYEEEPELYAAKTGYGEYVGQDRHRPYVHPGATAQRMTGSSTLDVALPRLTSPEDRIKYANWLPIVPTVGKFSDLVDERKVPYFVELQEREIAAVEQLRRTAQERRP